VIFVDTSFWVAIRNVRDDHHDEARRLLMDFGARSLITTNHVRGESWTFLRRRIGHLGAMGFLDSLDRSVRLDVIAVSGELEDRAWSWLRKHDERAYSFVDATSFALMRSMKIKDALAYDGDFSAAGFRELRP
jgi:predicted nucleic acid-binding protein